MIKLNALPLALLFCLAQISCDSSDVIKDPPALNCDDLITGLLSYDNEQLKPFFEEYTKNLVPNSETDDPTGHKKNFQTLVQRLNQCELLTAELLCYNCIETLPGQSEILITIDSANKPSMRIVDILTPEDDTLSFVRVHKYDDGSIILNKSDYIGCFIEESKANVSEYKITGSDTLYYTIKDDTLTLNAVFDYSCARTLTDSVIMNGDNVQIYISDTSKSDVFADCICNYGFTYKFTGFWQKNTHFFVYWRGYLENKYILWKDTKFIDGLD